MKLRSLLSACLLVTFRDSFVDSRSVEKDGVGLAQKHSNLGKLLGGTPVEKASQFGLDENHKKGKTGDSSDQSPVTNQYEASPDANVYGTQNTYSTGVTYGSTQPLYGNQNGMSSAPSNYPYSAGAYGANPCGCNQMPQGGAYSQPNSVQGSKLQRNQDAMGGRSSQSNQGYSVVQPNAHYPAYPVPYSPPAPVYSGPVMNYGYQQYNPYNYPYSTYPYGYYGYPAYPHHHQQKASQHKKRSGRRTKKHRVKKQHSDKPSDKHRDGQRENFRNDERMNEKMDDSKESDM